MIVVQDYINPLDDIDRVIYKSNKGYKIQKVGSDLLYDSAVELNGVEVEYEETDVLAEYGSEMYG